MISIDNLSVSYGGWSLFDQISFLINPKDRIGLVGKNGAGKTTGMMTIAGFLRPDSGEIDLLGAGPFDAARHAGRIAKGYAKCSPDDEFDMETGKKLAAARCNMIVTARKEAAAEAKLPQKRLFPSDIPKFMNSAE